MSRITNEGRCRFKIVPKTGQGRPAPLDGPATFACDNPDVVLEQDSDTSVIVTAPNITVATAVLITVSADADMDPGEERHLTGSGALEIVPAEAQSIELDFEDLSDEPGVPDEPTPPVDPENP